jgi:hypothetical protein
VSWTCTDYWDAGDDDAIADDGAARYGTLENTLRWGIHTYSGSGNRPLDVSQSITGFVILVDRESASELLSSMVENHLFPDICGTQQIAPRGIPGRSEVVQFVGTPGHFLPYAQAEVSRDG